MPRKSTYQRNHAECQQAVEAVRAEYEARVAKLEEHLRIARDALEDLAGIESPGGWTQNMAARVALHKLDGRL